MTEIDKSRDDQIYRMRLLGSSPREVAENFSISIAAVDEAVDRTMVKVDNFYRLREMALDLERVEAMLARFLTDALNGDLAAGHLCLKIAERKAAMLGADAPVRIDAVQLVEHTPESSTDRIERAPPSATGNGPRRERSVRDGFGRPRRPLAKQSTVQKTMVGD